MRSVFLSNKFITKQTSSNRLHARFNLLIKIVLSALGTEMISKSIKDLSADNASRIFSTEMGLGIILNITTEV
jgi:hypothetical protein